MPLGTQRNWALRGEKPSGGTTSDLPCRSSDLYQREGQSGLSYALRLIIHRSLSGFFFWLGTLLPRLVHQQRQPVQSPEKRSLRGYCAKRIDG